MTDRPAPPPRPVLSYAGTDQSADPSACWANGPFLVLRTTADLPMRCIKCNRPTEIHVRKRLYWADTRADPAGGGMRSIPFLRVFFAFQSMFRWFGDMGASRTLVVAIPVCRRHRFRSRLLTLSAWLAFPVGVSTLLLPVGEQLHLWGPVIGFFVSAILFSRPRPVKAVHVGIGHVTLSGVGGDYLNSLSAAHPKRAPSVADMLNSADALRQRLAAKKRSE